ncbi:MAG: TIGR01210 family radical SAM protein [Candidatus Lokiarchaeota archaeon]|nr:TIGR01210 family radical SAM protein [Candidatus Lokiarchaeota archaeon]
MKGLMIMRQLKSYKDIRNAIVNETFKIRTISKKKFKGFKRIDLSKPVATWIKEDRLRKELGYEFTIILRTSACRWARSESGGCTMCGYFNDRGPKDIDDNLVIEQIKHALKKHEEEIAKIKKENKHIILKIFTSGSFLDTKELSIDTQQSILDLISEIETITEIVVESRPEFITDENLRLLRQRIPNKTIEIGIGIESTNDFVREILINKGFSLGLVNSAINIAHNNDFLVKAYLLLKPPFLSERIAIQDAIDSIKTVVQMGVDTISLNPVNIQKYTLTDTLFYKHQYRPPWIYSALKVFQESLTEEIIEKVLIVCDPSAKGREKGIHNCKSRDCNQRWLDILQKFIFTQDLRLIQRESLPYNMCSCWEEYNVYLDSNYL